MPRVILYTATTCTQCPAAKKIFKEIVNELNLKEGSDYVIKNVDEGDNMIEALQHQVAATPSFVIDDELYSSGVVPKKSELLEFLKEKFGK